MQEAAGTADGRAVEAAVAGVQNDPRGREAAAVGIGPREVYAHLIQTLAGGGRRRVRLSVPNRHAASRRSAGCLVYSSSLCKRA